MPDNILDIQDLLYSIGWKKLFNGFSLEIGKGERVGVFGRSGSGKSTLLRLIAGFIAPLGGVIRLKGKVVTHGKNIVVPPEKRGIGFVFQDIALWPHLSVEKNLAFPVRNLAGREKQDRMEKMLALIELEEKRRAYPSQLSGGEQQRVALGRALIAGADLLLMDEPFTALDPRLREDMAGLCMRLMKEKETALIIVSHRPEDIDVLADRSIEL